MDPEKLRKIVEEAIKNVDQFKWWLYIVVILLTGLASYLGSYLRRKAENLATKEDTSAITREVERIRVEYAERLENLSHQNRLLLEQANRRHRLRMAALERRLEAHQQAYALWWELLRKVHKEEIGDLVMECEDWWVKNCLYLDAEGRQAFKTAVQAAFDHRTFLRPVFDAYAAKENWSRIIAAGDAIVKGVELPSLGEGEYSSINLPEIENG